MRPIELTIEGLTSYRQRQVVDFTDLDLFVITGPTGAGKSSILDAMTLALYGSVARVNGHELKDLISHGQSHMRVQFDFAIDGEQFRVARVFGRTKAQVISFERFDGDALAPVLDKAGVREINQKIEELIGLDFSAFTKAVLLPQGEFAAFLKGEAGERRKTLVRLLDLNRYERAGQVARREVSRLDAVLGEQKSQIESEYADATADRKRELKELVDASKLREAAAKSAREKATSLATEAIAATSTIDRVEKTIIEVTNARDALEALAEKWPTLAATLGTATTTRDEAERTFAADTTALAGARKRLMQTVAKTGDAASLASLTAAARALAREEETLEKFAGELADAEKRLVACGKTCVDVEAQEAAVVEALEANQAALAVAQLRVQHTKAALQCSERTRDLARIEASLAKAEKQVADARAKSDAARVKMEHLRSEHLAVELRVGLSIGAPCPVCEVIIDKLPESQEGLEHLFAEAQSELAVCDELQHAANDSAISLRAERKSAQNELSKAQAELPSDYAIPADAKEARAEHASAERELKATQGAERAAATSARAIAKQVTDARSAASAAQAKRDGSRKAIEDAEERKGAAVETLRASLGNKLPADVLVEIERRRTALSEAEEALTTAQAAADSSRDRRDETERDVVGAQKAVAGYEANLAAVRASAKGACLGLANELAGEGLPDLPTESDEHGVVTAAWRTYCDAHSKTAEKRVHTLRTELENVAGRLAKVATEIGLDLNGALPSEALSRFGDAVTDAHGAVVGAEKDLSALLDRIKTRVRLEKAIAKEQQERALYRQLADELRSDRFIGFVLEESMNQLADQASLELLRISDDRYSLAAEGGDFDVIDHTNADERRSVATLSGGETFLASLSLALALSAGLREFARTAAARLDAIFIDEGFGALDPETLEVVVDALERLRDGDRMVGVITHVPTLAERIPAGLRVEAAGGSSRITVRS